MNRAAIQQGLSIVLVCLLGWGCESGDDGPSGPGGSSGALGTRTNPAGFGQTVRSNAITFGDIFGSGEIELTLLEIIRGQQALQIVIDGNQFNEVPGPGDEYILARFRVRVLSRTSDNAIDINHARFDPVVDDVVSNRLLRFSRAEFTKGSHTSS
jgi:hypothetical protein